MLAEARPLADLLWMRETVGRRVRDAGAARRAGEDAARADQRASATRACATTTQQEMRDRVQALLRLRSARRPQQAGRRRQALTAARAAASAARCRRGAGRLAVSESLTRSALVKRAGGVMPLREAVLVVTLVNHPQLVDEHFDQFENLELSPADLRKLHAALDRRESRMARRATAPATVEAIRSAGLGRCWRAGGRADPQGPAVAGAGGRGARRRARGVRAGAALARAAPERYIRSCKAAEAALATEPTDENYRI